MFVDVVYIMILDLAVFQIFLEFVSIVGPCGFPNIPGVCINCGKAIGYGKLPPGIKGGHGFAHVPGHLRIFKDKAQKDKEMARYGDNDKNIPNKLLAEYKRDKIDPILEKDRFGLSKVEKVVFEDS